MLAMDEDKDVSVSFEQRAKITITHAGPPQLLLRWGIDYTPAAQKGGGNPLTLRGQFDCDTDFLADCAKTAFFDTGTTIILKAGTGVDAGNLASISGACNTSESTCEFSLDARQHRHVQLGVLGLLRLSRTVGGVRPVTAPRARFVDRRRSPALRRNLALLTFHPAPSILAPILSAT